MIKKWIISGLSYFKKETRQTQKPGVALLITKKKKKIRKKKAKRDRENNKMIAHDTFK